MKTIYVVTEGTTDQIVLEGLLNAWMDDDFVARIIQPPSSEYAAGLDTRLSQGWKGVVAWCQGRYGAVGRDEALRMADCLIVHVDADVAGDVDFRSPAFAGLCPPAEHGCNWVREHLTGLFGETLPDHLVLCVPSRDMETWVLSALYPEVADTHQPIECRREPGALLVGDRKYRLVRRKDGSLKKASQNYRAAAADIAAGWSNCAGSDSPRCPEAKRFETELRRVLEG